MSTRVRVRVGDATVEGLHLAGVTRFSALRYAQAPTGRLRFAPPVPYTLEGKVDACVRGAIAPQGPSALRSMLGDFVGAQSEDCLHLTVWMPGEASLPEAVRPVLVWLHGGALQNGGAAIDWYDGAALARRAGCVLVAVSYRLGVLGWLCAQNVDANLGLSDQALALQWICAHISAFGGDANRITVMGQSSGGLCTAALLAQGPAVFSRVILQSAPLGRPLREPQQAMEIGDALLRAAGAADLDSARQLSVAQLLQAQQAPEVREVLQAATATDRAGLFHPVGDGVSLPAALDIASLAAQVDVLVGSTCDEAAAFGAVPRADAKSVEDPVFGQPARRWAQAATAAERQAWLYRFDVGSNARYGACHCIDLPFVFGTFDAFRNAPMLDGLEPARAARVHDEVQRAWAAFVRGEDLPWPPGPQIHLFQ